MATGRDADDLVFGATADQSFYPSSVRRRALAGWGWKYTRGGPQSTLVQAREDALTPIGLHEARHTFASVMIAAGCNAKALSKIMGHASIAITFDVYGHLMPGGESEARERVDSYLAGFDGGSRLRAVGE